MIKMKNEKVETLNPVVLDPETPVQNMRVALFSDRKINFPTFWKTDQPHGLVVRVSDY
jgi:hypothetical protein